MASHTVATLAGLVQPEAVTVKLKTFGLLTVTEDLFPRVRFLRYSIYSGLRHPSPLTLSFVVPRKTVRELLIAVFIDLRRFRIFLFRLLRLTAEAKVLGVAL